MVDEELRRSGCTRAAATASLHDPVLADLKTCGGVAVALHAWRSLMLESSTMPGNKQIFIRVEWNDRTWETLPTSGHSPAPLIYSLPLETGRGVLIARGWPLRRPTFMAAWGGRK